MLSRFGVASDVRVLVGLLAAVVVGLVAATGAGATSARRNGEILSYSDGSGFWLSGPQGQHPTSLTVPAAVLSTAGFGGPTFPTFSPSGRRLAFLYYNDPESTPPFTYGVVVTNAHGKAAHVVVRGKLTQAFFVWSGLAFSPDGRTLAYGIVNARHVPRGNPKNVSPFATRFVLVNVRSGRVVRSMVLPGDLNGLTWAASGDLLFVSDYGKLYAVRPDGTHKHQINVQFPGSWGLDSYSTVASSPDGSQLAVTATDVSEDDGVFLVPATGGNAKQLGRSGCCPVWSPNGREVLFGFDGTQPLITLATGRSRTLHVPGAALAWQPLPRQTRL